MNSITNHDRISALLFRYNHIRYDIEFDAPFDLTQDGIAMHLGISRGHSNILLKRMIENNELIIGSATIRGSSKPNKRKIYVLSEYGKKVFRDRVKDLSANGQDVQELVKGIDRFKLDDIRRTVGDRMPDLGCAAVLRVRIRKEDAPLESPYLPTRTGYAEMNGTVRNAILSGGYDEEIRYWHSRAADWCMDHGIPLTERLFHLIRSGRDREALRILREHG
jgi:hypothetical protein